MSATGPSPTDRALRGRLGRPGQLRKHKGSPSLGQGLRWAAGGDAAARTGGPPSGDPVPRAMQRHQRVLSKTAGFILMLLWLEHQNWMGWGQGARSGGCHPWDQSGHRACEHPWLPTEMALNDAALGQASYCVWICQGSWKAHLGRANVDGREAGEPPRKVEGRRHLGQGPGWQEVWGRGWGQGWRVCRESAVGGLGLSDAGGGEGLQPSCSSYPACGRLSLMGENPRCLQPTFCGQRNGLKMPSLWILPLGRSKRVPTTHQGTPGAHG